MASLRKGYDRGRPARDEGEKEAPASMETMEETKPGEEPGPARAVRGTSEGGMAARHKAERDDRHKTEEGERRDMHERHRGEHRDLNRRHEEAHAAIDHMDAEALAKLHRAHEHERHGLAGRHVHERHEMANRHHMARGEMHARHEMEVREGEPAAADEGEKREAA
jgi:hypothetical protein